MKQFLISLIILISFEKAKSAEFDGYYVTKNNDTIYTKLYFPLFADDPFHQVEIYDSAISKKVKLKPADISCYVYFDGSKKMVYVSKSFDNDLLFYERRIRNSNYCLYSYWYEVGGGTNQIGKIKLIIARNDSVYITINSEDNAKKTREKLKGFFTEPDIQQKIEEIFRYRAMAERDAFTFVHYLNKE
jgi:hypothetical protein